MRFPRRKARATASFVKKAVSRSTRTVERSIGAFPLRRHFPEKDEVKVLSRRSFRHVTDRNQWHSAAFPMSPRFSATHHPLSLFTKGKSPRSYANKIPTKFAVSERKALGGNRPGTNRRCFIFLKRFTRCARAHFFRGAHGTVKEGTLNYPSCRPKMDTRVNL